MSDEEIPTVEDWQEYERRKKELPILSPTDYEAAVVTICNKLSL